MAVDQASRVRVLELGLERQRELLVGVGPFRHPHLPDVGRHRLGDGLVEVLGPGAAQHPDRFHRGAGHHRGAGGDRVQDRPHLLDMGEVQLAQVVPHRGILGDHVGLVAAVGDHVVGALGDPQVLAPEIPGDVGELHRIERAAAPPRRAGRVGRLALEGVEQRDQAVAVARAPRHAEVAAHMTEQADVHIVEQSAPHVVRLGAHQLLGDAGPDLEGAGDVIALHESFGREGRGDVHRHPAVVPFPMTGRAGNQGVAAGDAGFLGGLGDAVDVGADGDHRLAGTPGRNPRGRDAEVVLLDREAFATEQGDQVLGGFEFLEAELAEGENLVHHFLGELGPGIHVGHQLALEAIEPGIGRGWRRGLLGARGLASISAGIRIARRMREPGCCG